jgi:hypothetical protein
MRAATPTGKRSPVPTVEGDNWPEREEPLSEVTLGEARHDFKTLGETRRTQIQNLLKAVSSAGRAKT